MHAFIMQAREKSREVASCQSYWHAAELPRYEAYPAPEEAADFHNQHISAARFVPQSHSFWDHQWRFLLAVLVHKAADTDRLDLATFDIDMQAPATHYKQSRWQAQSAQADVRTSTVDVHVGPYVLLCDPPNIVLPCGESDPRNAGCKPAPVCRTYCAVKQT